MAKLDVTNLFPWNKMEVRTENGQRFIFIPNTWVRNEPLPAGATYQDKVAYMISEKEQSGYHLHPMFKKNGVANSEGTLVGEDIIAGGNIMYTELVAKAATYGTGIEPYNIYDHHFIARLMLIEYGSADLQTLITGSNTGQNANYHGFKNAWGDATNSRHFWIYGLDTNNTLGINNQNIHILSSDMDGTMVDTGVAPCGGGWPVTLLRTKGSKFDLGDVFLAATVDGTEGNGTLGAYQNLYAGFAFYADYDRGSSRGPFYLSNDAPTHKHSAICFRLRKAA